MTYRGMRTPEDIRREQKRELRNTNLSALGLIILLFFLFRNGGPVDWVFDCILSHRVIVYQVK